MDANTNRRNLLKGGLAAGAMLGVGDLGFLSRLRPLSAAEVELDPKAVRFDSGIEPVVRMIETTPRERLLEEVAGQIQKGLSYREVLAGLLLAGVRNVQPRPSVGFKFHAVLVVNSAHLASLSSPPQHRWLPLFWALDYFKSAAARDVREGDWTMPAVDESAVPAASKARTTFRTAMEQWDEPAADVAVAALARSAGVNEIQEMFFRFGARDFRSIGHKAIFVANSFRTLQCIGWQHAEPVLRSLAYALLMHEDGNPATRDADADRPYRRNRELVGKIREDWRDGQLDPSATTTMLSSLRNDSDADASEQVVEMLNRGVSPQSVWDALFLGAGELLMRQPGIVALHAVTTTNALRYAFQSSGNDETRRLLMLQNAAFLPMFREAMRGRGRIGDAQIDSLESAESKSQPGLEAIFSDVSRAPMDAARGVVGFLGNSGDARELIDAARMLVFLKGNDAHDYKFSSAVLEDYYHVSPAWRDRFLASSVFKLSGSGDPDNTLVERTRAAFAG